jgi:tellurite resistance protein
MNESGKSPLAAALGRVVSTEDLPARFDAGAYGPESLPVIPAAFFGMVLGLAGLGAAWRAAQGVWGLPAPNGEGIYLLAGLVWVALISLFAAKRIFLPVRCRCRLNTE